MKKVLVIGIDAADYDIIAQGKYPHLKQVEYGRAEINVEPLFTPVIWASFITGVQSEEHGIKGMHKWKRGLLDTLRNRTLKTGLSHRKTGKTMVSIGSLLERIGFTTQLYGKSDLKVSSIFDYVDRCIAISVPSYNEDPINPMLRKKLKDALGSGKRKLIRETESLAWKVFEEKKKRVMDVLDRNWSLFMVHFFILDVLQHLFWYNDKYINNAYEKMNKTVGLINEKMSSDCFTLIASDHGHKEGMHTPYGFYSCNKKLGLNEPKLTDFADIIRAHLGLPSREDEQRISKHLKSLGYA